MILLIEHGQTALDRKGEAHGGRDTPLDAEGRRQAVRLGERLARAERKPQVVYHSPKIRARQTARIAADIARIPSEEARELAPLRSGALGRGPEKAVARRLGPYFANPERRIPGGESVAAWRHRHLAFMRRIQDQAGSIPVAMVTHSNVIGSVEGGAQGAKRAMARPPKAAEVDFIVEGRGLRRARK